MVVLDTDHATLLGQPSNRERDAILARIRRQPAPFVVAATIVTYEEQMRGWLAFVAAARNVQDQVFRYARLSEHVEFYRRTSVLPFDNEAAAQFERLRSLKLRVGTMDLKSPRSHL